MNTRKLFPIVFLAVLVLLALAACNHPTQTVTPVVTTETTEPVETEATEAPVATSTPAPTATPEPLYAIRMTELETSAEAYGDFYIAWKLVRDVEGLPLNKQHENLRTIVDGVLNLCPNNEYGISSDYAYVIKHSDSRVAMTEQCWNELEKVSGKELAHSDPNIGQPRVDTCTGSAPCNILNDVELESIKSGLYKRDMVVAKGAQYYNVSENFTRIEPNIAKYPGFGFRFLYPTEVRLEGPVQVPQLGIINWSGTHTLCINLPGLVGEGEGGLVVPGNTSKCIDGSAMADAFAQDGYWAFASQAVLDDGLTLTWYWTAEMRGETLVLHIMDVVATQFTLRDQPKNIGPQFHVDPDSQPARKYTKWHKGDLVKVLEANYSYQRVPSSATVYTGWRHSFESAVLDVNGDKVTITSDFVVSRPCTEGCVEVSSWEMPEDLVGETLIVEHVYDDPETAMTSVWLESTIPAE